MIYLDTSAFLDLYLEREGSTQIKKILASEQKPIAMSPLVELESHSVLGRLVTSKALTKHSRLEFEQRIMTDVQLGYIIQATIELKDVLEKCIEISKQNGYSYRTMDTAHVVSAALANVDLFVGSDKDQSELAKKIGLKFELIRKDQ